MILLRTMADPLGLIPRQCREHLSGRPGGPLAARRRRLGT